MDYWKAAWKETARVFLLSRLLILTITTGCILFLPGLIPGYLQSISSGMYPVFKPQSLNLLFLSWLRWDEKPFLNISYFGYKHTPDVAFFPLWPLLRHLGGLLLGNVFPASYYLAGLLLANLLFFFALALLYVLVANTFDQFIARRALLYLTFSPYALFFFAGYSESLFLLLCVAMFLFLQRGKRLDWWLAGLCGMLATLTREVGLLLAIPFSVLYVQRFWPYIQLSRQDLARRLVTYLPVALIPMGLIVYMIYLYIDKGNPWLFTIEESAVWGRHLTFPPVTLILTIQAFFQEPLFVLQLENLLNLAIVVLSFIILVVGWRLLPLHYSVFTLLMILLSLSVPMYIPQFEPLLSQPRFILVLFPFAIIFAIWSKHPRFHRVCFILSITFFILNTALFVSNIWVG